MVITWLRNSIDLWDAADAKSKPTSRFTGNMARCEIIKAAIYNVWVHGVNFILYKQTRRFFPFHLLHLGPPNNWERASFTCRHFIVVAELRIALISRPIRGYHALISLSPHRLSLYMYIALALGASKVNPSPRTVIALLFFLQRACSRRWLIRRAKRADFLSTPLITLWKSYAKRSRNGILIMQQLLRSVCSYSVTIRDENVSIQGRNILYVLLYIMSTAGGWKLKIYSTLH